MRFEHVTTRTVIETGSGGDPDRWLILLLTALPVLFEGARLLIETGAIQ